MESLRKLEKTLIKEFCSMNGLDSTGSIRQLLVRITDARIDEDLIDAFVQDILEQREKERRQKQEKLAKQEAKIRELEIELEGLRAKNRIFLNSSVTVEFKENIQHGFSDDNVICEGEKEKIEIENVNRGIKHRLVSVVLDPVETTVKSVEVPTSQYKTAEACSKVDVMLHTTFPQSADGELQTETVISCKNDQVTADQSFQVTTIEESAVSCYAKPSNVEHAKKVSVKFKLNLFSQLDTAVMDKLRLPCETFIELQRTYATLKHPLSYSGGSGFSFERDCVQDALESVNDMPISLHLALIALADKREKAKHIDIVSNTIVHMIEKKWGRVTVNSWTLVWRTPKLNPYLKIKYFTKEG